jgi:hypothetical protein
MHFNGVRRKSHAIILRTQGTEPGHVKRAKFLAYLPVNNYSRLKPLFVSNLASGIHPGLPGVRVA